MNTASPSSQTPSAVIQLGEQREARLSATSPSPAQLAARFPGRILLPDTSTPISGVPLFAVGVRAGLPSPADDYLDTQIDLNAYLIDDEQTTFMVRIEDDSMVGAGLYEGDLLVVDKRRVPVHGDIVVAALDGDFTVKRLQRHNGQISLHPDHPDFPIVIPSYAQDFAIWGVATGCVKKF
jgi:DNA polymerase V